MRQSLKAYVFVAAASGVLGASGSAAYADAGAGGGARNSPGVLSGNSIQVTVDAPVNACGNSVDAGAALNPAMGNACGNGAPPAPALRQAPPAQRAPVAQPPAGVEQAPGVHWTAPDREHRAEPARRPAPERAERPVTAPEQHAPGHAAGHVRGPVRGPHSRRSGWTRWRGPGRRRVPRCWRPPGRRSWARWPRSAAGCWWAGRCCCAGPVRVADERMGRRSPGSRRPAERVRRAARPRPPGRAARRHRRTVRPRAVVPLCRRASCGWKRPCGRYDRSSGSTGEGRVRHGKDRSFAHWWGPVFRVFEAGRNRMFRGAVPRPPASGKIGVKAAKVMSR